MSPRSPATPLLPARVLPRVVAGLQFLGVDPRPGLEAIGIDPADLPLREAEVPIKSLSTFWTEVVRSSGESGLGLRLSEQLRPEYWDVFGCLIAASASLGDAVLRATRLVGLLTQTVRLSFRHEGVRASLSVEPLFPELVHPESMDFMMGAPCVLSRRITGRDLALVEARFVRPAPPDLTHHQRVFGPTIHFGCPTNEIVFDAALLDVPIVSHDSSLCAALQRQAEDLLAHEPTRGFTAEVRSALAAELRGGEPTAERIGALLDMHPKTMTRRLKAEGTTFRRVLDELRLQLAERYLRQPGLGVEEVAFLLGYSERSAFHRAYRRWTGRAPREE